MKVDLALWTPLRRVGHVTRFRWNPKVALGVNGTVRSAEFVEMAAYVDADFVNEWKPGVGSGETLLFLRPPDDQSVENVMAALAGEATTATVQLLQLDLQDKETSYGRPGKVRLIGRCRGASGVLAEVEV